MRIKRETKQEARKRDVLCQDISKPQFSFLLVSRVSMLNAGSKGISQGNVNVITWTNSIN